MINHKEGGDECAVGVPLINDEVFDFVSRQPRGCTRQTAVRDGVVGCVRETREELGVKLFDPSGFIPNSEA